MKLRRPGFAAFAFRPWGDTTEESAKRAREWKGLKATSYSGATSLARALQYAHCNTWERGERAEGALELEVPFLSSLSLSHSSIHQAQLFKPGVPESVDTIEQVGLVGTHCW